MFHKDSKVTKSVLAKNHFAEFFSGISRFHPARLVFAGYLWYVIAGWLLLCLPFVQKGQGVKCLDNLFIATSAVSTTGLATVSIADCYNLSGQIIILFLIQLGGIGYMTLGSFMVLSRKTEISPFRLEIGRTVFSLPESFRIDKFVKSVIRFTLVTELVGALALYFIFRNGGVSNPIWSAIFHSVSSFCTAGFGLYNNSFESFANDFWLNLVISLLSYLGAIGFIVYVDLWRMLRGKVATITMTSKIILWMTFWMTVAGTTLLFFNEPSIQSKPADQRFMAAFFQCMTAMTTVGFNSIPIGSLSKASVLLMIVLMVIGASPSGTGGGIKSTSFSALLGVMKSTFRGQKEVYFWNKVIPAERVLMAVASVSFYLCLLIVGTYFLELTENTPFECNAFEAASAIGTVGLSMGITAGLSIMGKLIITALMFFGRVGPLALGTTLFFRLSSHTEKPITEKEDLAI